MRKAISMAMVALLVAAGPAMAQGKVEVSALVGWTFSDGVSGTAIKAPNGNTYDHIDLKDSFNWGLMFGVLATPNVEVGFLFGQQQSTLRIGGSATTDIGSINVANYHGYIGYNFGDAEAKVRPYIFGGLGATSYPSVSFTTAAGNSASTLSSTKFSTTWGAGVKIYPSPKVGVRLGLRWTPTYVKTDATGWWCDPYWGCYVTGDAQYLNQFDFSGGIVIRF
jgi:outer membrane protein W